MTLFVLFNTRFSRYASPPRKFFSNHRDKLKVGGGGGESSVALDSYRLLKYTSRFKNNSLSAREFFRNAPRFASTINVIYRQPQRNMPNRLCAEETEKKKIRLLQRATTRSLPFPSIKETHGTAVVSNGAKKNSRQAARRSKPPHEGASVDSKP